jgi:hypothetical protein
LAQAKKIQRTQKKQPNRKKSAHLEKISPIKKRPGLGLALSTNSKFDANQKSLPFVSPAAIVLTCQLIMLQGILALW